MYYAQSDSLNYIEEDKILLNLQNRIENEKMLITKFILLYKK